MAFISTGRLATPNYGRNGILNLTKTATGTNVFTDIVSTSDAKSWMKVENNVEDSLIDNLIEEIIDVVEEQYSFQLLEKNVVAEYENYSQTVELPLYPVKSITSVKTINNEGTETTLTVNSDYYVQGDTLVFFQTHPYEYPYDRVRLKVSYVAGFDPIPNGIILGLKKAILSSYEDRQDLAEGSVSMLSNGSKSFFNRYTKFT